MDQARLKSREPREDAAETLRTRRGRSPSREHKLSHAAVVGTSRCCAVILNTAISAELQRVAGMAHPQPTRFRKCANPMACTRFVDDLLAIKRTGQKRFDKMRKYLTVGKAPLTKWP